MQTTIHTQELIQNVGERLNGSGVADGWRNGGEADGARGSAVLFLLTRCETSDGGAGEPCLLLTKRSEMVMQPGDLCCPGGGIESIDRLFSHVLQWPFAHLRKWPTWREWRVGHPDSAQKLALLLAAALREGWEEMRLNPLRVRFLGPLPVQRLIMFKRHIYPLAGWMPPQQRLVPNWEVERIVRIPLSQLLDASNYARYRLTFHANGVETRRKEDFPCFVHRCSGEEEILWGATLRITLDFLNLAYGFQLPDLGQAPVIQRQLTETYLNGSRTHRNGANTVEDPHDY